MKLTQAKYRRRPNYRSSILQEDNSRRTVQTMLRDALAEPGAATGVDIVGDGTGAMVGAGAIDPSVVELVRGGNKTDERMWITPLLTAMSGNAIRTSPINKLVSKTVTVYVLPAAVVNVKPSTKKLEGTTPIMT